MKIIKKTDLKFFTSIALVALFSIAFGRAYMRIQTTLIGYDLGTLKKQESHLLEARSRLQMELAKLTTKNNLMLLAKEQNDTTSLGAYAAQ